MHFLKQLKIDTYKIIKQDNIFSLAKNDIFVDRAGIISFNPSTITDECKYSLIENRTFEWSFPP